MTDKEREEIYKSFRKKINKNTLKKIYEEEDLTLLAKTIIQNYKIKTIYETNNKTMYIYKNGKYEKNARKIIEPYIEQTLKQKSTNHKVSEVIGKIQRRTQISKEEFETIPEGKVLLKNGVLDLKTQKLEAFNPDYYFKTRIPIKYDENAECPRIIKFFKETFYKEDLKTIQEWIGFQLYNKYLYKKAIILYGPPDTGKSVFMNLLKKFIGRENCANISLHRICRGKTFDMTQLHQKLSNTFDDLRETNISVGQFKPAVGDSYISAEYKFGDNFDFINYAKHTFTCNTIPGNEETQDEAYYKRWMPIPVDNQISESEKNPFLIDELTSDEELSGLLNWGLKGLERLLKNNKFSYHHNVDEVKDIMQRESTPLIAFVNDCLEKSMGHRISKDKLYNFYRFYCSEHNFSCFGKRKLTIRLKKVLPYITDTHSGDDRQWLNVSIRFNSIDRDDWDDFLKTIKKNESRIKGRINKGNRFIYMFSEKSPQTSQNECAKCGKSSGISGNLHELKFNEKTYYFCDDCIVLARDVKRKRKEENDKAEKVNDDYEKKKEQGM
ncbi:MAG: phage/plasmid primase, P4 family [Bacteroidales bacterium]